MLSQCYAAPDSWGDLGDEIYDVTVRNAGGHAAFGSILFDDGVRGENGEDFYGLLSALGREGGVRVLGVYGAEDQWIDPFFAKRAFGALQEKASGGGPEPPHLYLLSSAAHCPNHEQPSVVAGIVSSWMEGTEYGGAGEGEGVVTRVTDFALNPARKAFVDLLV